MNKSSSKSFWYERYESIKDLIPGVSINEFLNKPWYYLGLAGKRAIKKGIVRSIRY